MNGKRKIYFFVWGGIGIAFVFALYFFLFGTYKTFEVKKEKTGLEESGAMEDGADKNRGTECVVSGCSGQLCVDAKAAGNRATTCEWTEEYGCYKNAECSVQAGGQCGWTKTDALESCLQKAREKTQTIKTVTEDNSVKIKTDTPSIEGQEKSAPNFSITKKLVSWGFVKADNRKINSVILHSSYNPLGGDKYDVDAVIAIYKTYEVSPHYLIDRSGKILQLVSEKNIAYHAGVSTLPDGEINVNAVSIGIEILNDDKGDAYTDAQYKAVNALLADIEKRYTIKYVLGHKDIAPSRKTDPWNLDWDKISRKKF